MAYAGGYAGGYADTIVPPAPTPQPAGGGYQYLPARPASRRKGRATIRLRVTILTWGAEAHNTAHLTLAAASQTAGGGETRATTLIDTGMTLRYGHATGIFRAELGTRIADPHEDDRRIAHMVAALLEHQEQ